MVSIQQLLQRRADILQELARLDEMRRGSIVEQYVECTRKDGSQVRRGPYCLYSYKEKGQTVSRRLSDPEEVARYRSQIERYRRFEVLTTQLREIGEQVSDRAIHEAEGRKTSRRRCRSRGTRKSSESYSR